MPGDRIIVVDGSYLTTAPITVNQAGTAAQPIIIEAQSISGVEISGTHGFSLDSPAAYILIRGFKFTHPAGGNTIHSGAAHCRFTRNIFECSGAGNFLLVAGHDTEIDHNEFLHKGTDGNMIDVRGSGGQIARRVWIHHNYFHDFFPSGSGDAETIRFGLSGLSMSTGEGRIEYNLFVNCRGENELISNKSSGNTYRYNTFLNSAGAQLTLRHGNDCLVYGNYFRGTDGLRVFGDRHLIFSNYFEGNTQGVQMGNGGGEVAEGAALTSHDRPDDGVVAFNTFLNNNTHYRMAGRTHGLGAVRITVANNIFQGGGTIADLNGPYTGSWLGNICWNTGSAGDMPSSGYQIRNPLLSADANGIVRLQAASPLIDAAAGSFPFVTVDMDGQPRDANPDIGADEFSDAPVVARILTVADVGPFPKGFCPVSHTLSHESRLPEQLGGEREENSGLADGAFASRRQSNGHVIEKDITDRSGLGGGTDRLRTYPQIGPVLPVHRTDISSRLSGPCGLCRARRLLFHGRLLVAQSRYRRWFALCAAGRSVQSE